MCLLLLAASVIATSDGWGYLAILSVLLGIVSLSKLRPGVVFGAIHRLWLFFVVIFIMNALFYSDAEPILSWGVTRLTAQGMKQGAKIIVNVAYIMALSNVLIRTTAPMDLTQGLNNLMKPLRLLRVPVEDVAMILSIALRFIPTQVEDAVAIKKAQTARGARFESKKLHERISSFLPLLIPVFMSAFRRADELAMAMEARGYRNARNRTGRVREPLKPEDFVALMCSIFICLAQMFFLG